MVQGQAVSLSPRTVSSSPAARRPDASQGSPCRRATGLSVLAKLDDVVPGRRAVGDGHVRAVIVNDMVDRHMADALAVIGRRHALGRTRKIGRGAVRERVGQYV